MTLGTVMQETTSSKRNRLVVFGYSGIPSADPVWLRGHRTRGEFHVSNEHVERGRAMVRTMEQSQKEATVRKGSEEGGFFFN